MKRALLFAAILLAAVVAKAQSFSPFGVTSPLAFGRADHRLDSAPLPSRWSFTKYAVISTGFVTSRAGSGSFFSAPLGLQVNRQLTNNVSAFGAISVVPSYFYSNSAFYQPGIKNGGSFMNTGNTGRFGAYPAAQLGVMYMNDQRTFSISGSVSVSRSSYGGFYPPF